MASHLIPPDPTAHETLVTRGVTLVPSGPEERADLLDETDWARRFTWQQIQSLAVHLRRYRLDAGRVLFKEGDHDAFMAVVLSGGLEIHKHDLADQDRVVARVTRGRLVGEMSLLDGAARSATAIAAEPTDLLVLTKHEFHRLGANHPTLAFEVTLAIATVIAQLLRQTTGALVEHLET
ncbi:MAG: cyclic nucleotide-binding domain-containing protein [Gemmatimonadales bacterium]|nr:cyclic nucleotide-binding domain-containing protein [Gemmatimonadales bacterium]